MSEDLIIKHCSPTLAGLKTANLFTCVYAQKQDIKRYTQEFNRRFSHKGVKMQPLGYGKSRALIYVFRPTQLKRDLSARSTWVRSLVTQSRVSAERWESFVTADILRLRRTAVSR